MAQRALGIRPATVKRAAGFVEAKMMHPPLWMAAAAALEKPVVLPSSPQESSSASATLVFDSDRSREMFVSQFGANVGLSTRLLPGNRSHISSLFAEMVGEREEFITALSAGSVTLTSEGAENVGLDVEEAELLAKASASDLRRMCLDRGLTPSSASTNDEDAVAAMRFRLLATPALDEFAAEADLEFQDASSGGKLDAKPLQSFFAMLDKDADSTANKRA